MHTPHYLSQGVQGPFSRSLLVFSLLLLCSATAKASIIVVWLPVEAETATDGEPQSASETSPTMAPRLPVASPKTPLIASAAPAAMQVQPPPLTDPPHSRFGQPVDGLYFFRDMQDLSMRKFAVDQHMIVAAVMRSAAQRTVAWAEAIGCQYFCGWAPLHSTTAVGQRLISAWQAIGPEKFRSGSARPLQWPEEVWAELDVTCPIANADADLDHWAATATETPATDPDGSSRAEEDLFLPEHLVEWELSNAAEPEKTDTSAIDGSARNLLRPVLRGTANVLSKMSLILADLSDRIEDASGPTAQTARRP